MRHTRNFAEVYGGVQESLGDPAFLKRLSDDESALGIYQLALVSYCADWGLTEPETMILFRYSKSRAEGTGHRLADMFAFQTPPHGVSDYTIMAGKWDDAGPDAGRYGNVNRKIAEAAGVNPSGKRYISQLARFPGDPMAWIDSMSELKNRVREQGKGCDGPFCNVPTPNVGRVPGKKAGSLKQRLHAAGLPVASN